MAGSSRGAQLGVDRLRAPRQDDPLGGARGQLGRGDVVADDLRVDPGFAYPAGDQLGVLGAEVDDQDPASSIGSAVHGQRPIPTPWDRCSGLPSVCNDGRDHDLGLLELLDRLVAAGGHRRPQRPEEVHPPVVLVGRSEQDLLQRAPHRRCAPGPRGAASGGRWPSPSGSRGRGLLGRGQRRAEHDGVGPAGDGLGDVPALAHPAVGDHVDVDAGLVEVPHAGPRPRRRWPWPGEPRYRGLPGWCRRSRADPDEHAHRPGSHQVQGGLVRGAAPDDDGDVELADEPLQVQRLDRLGDVFGRDHGALDDEHVEFPARMAGASSAVRCGVTEAHVVTPASRSGGSARSRARP